MRKLILFLMLAVLISMNLASLEWQNPTPIRQGVNIEWFRTGTETADNCAIYVWSDTKLGARDLYAQKVSATGTMVWGEPLLVDGKPDRQEDPVITRTSDDNFIIAWIDFSDDYDGNVYAQKVSSSGTLMWQTGGVPVCVYARIQISLNIEPDNAGGAYIVWEDNRNPGKDIYGQHLSSTGAPLWTVNGIPIANGDGDETYNTMWSDGLGGLIIGYVYSLSGADDLYVKRFLPNGQMAWNQPLPLSPVAEKQNKIKMAPINNDSFVFTWMDFRNTDPDIYAQRVDLNGNILWPDPFVVYTDSTATIPYPQENPRIVQTSDNAVIIIWEDKGNSSGEPDLYAQKIGLSGTKLWDIAGVPLCVADFSQSSPRMCSDNNGGCYVSWDDARNGNTANFDIYAQHLSSTGTSLWAPNGKAICTSPNEQTGALIKISGNNIFINWMDMRDGSVGINYQVLNLEGVAQLAENGIRVFWGLSGDATLKQVILLPRQNDTVVIWQDTRYSSLGYQIFYQIINPDGTVQFEANGKPITTLTGYDQNFPSAVVLPDDKIAIVWEENRSNNPKVYGQLLDSSGNKLWGDTGLAMTNIEPLAQKDSRVSYSDGAVYVGWSNLDTVITPEGPAQYYHVYGQKIVDNQKQWGQDGLLISQVPSYNIFIECELKTMVGRYFVWTRTNSHPDSSGITVFVKLTNADGTTATGWSDYGVLTSTYQGNGLIQFLPKAAMTDRGLFVEWLDFRYDGIKSIYGQLLSPSGQVLWDPLAVALADTGNEQDEFSIVGGNSVTTVWKESVTGSNQDIAKQRFSLDGVPQWGFTGNFIVQRDTTQSSPALAKFPQHGMIAVWEDFTDVAADIYYKQIEYDGTLLGDPNGEVVTDESMVQQYPLIAVAGNGTHAIISWADGRSSGKTPIFGIYAQKVANITLPDPTDIIDDQNSLLALTTSLNQNYPNPFNPETKISFNLAKDLNNVELVVYNLKGQKVKTLINGKTEKGIHSITWNGKDENHKSVASGVYLYKLKAGDVTKTRKMILMK